MVEEQTVEVNPEQPIRIHLNPPQIAQEDFEDTIEKGARILRKFPESKWTDDALFLIGQSYYYIGDYYLAIEKFEELNELTENQRFKQEALIWKARSLLDLEQYSEGIFFITTNLQNDYLTNSYKAQFQAVLAEHHVMQENWEEAAGFLGNAVADLQEGKLKGRAFFLYGQILEQLERYGEAFFAYDNVASRFPDYGYVYWSNVKKAEVARKDGNLESALSIYMAMAKDDKNVSRLDRINYEIARTLEMMGDITKAENGYKEILYSDKTMASANVEAKTYYRLGKIYSEEYDDFTTASAYFDSSSSHVGDIDFLESKFDAEKLASAYGTYTSLKNKVNRLDSLLWLGTLQPAALDSVLKVVREQKKNSSEQAQSSRDNTESKLTNISTGNAEAQAGGSSFQDGFLNYRNPRLKRESISKFRAVWGDRPLVDNWRRIEFVRSSDIVTGAPEVSMDDSESTLAVLSEENDREIDIDVSEIPTTKEQKEGYEDELANTKYQLGNLFFLTLNIPDSAKTYFTDIIRKYPGSRLVPQSMYSLFEIHSETGNEERLRYWGNRILREYPESRYADKISVRMNGAEPQAASDTASELLDQLQTIEETSDSSTFLKAEEFRRLAIANRSEDLAPYIFSKAIKTYVELAKSNTNSQLYNQFLEAQIEADTLSGTDSEETIDEELYPFFGTYWDSVRTTISEYDSLFTGRPLDKELKIVKKYLDADVPPPKSRSTARAPVSEKIVESCSALGPDFEIVGGMTNFLARVSFPAELKKSDIPEEITYEILISKEGKATASNLLTKQTAPAVDEVFTSAINNHLYFDPGTIADETEEARCRLTFPVKNPSKSKAKLATSVEDESTEIEACSDLDPDMDVVGGMKNFLSTVTYPKEPESEDLNTAGEITFKIHIKADGKATAMSLMSNSTTPALTKAFEKAINNHLYFDSGSLNDKVKNKSCSMTFPVKR